MSQIGLAEVGGYVLAGGKSSRMGTEKALIEIGGKPLVAHAVAKLREICAEVSILASNPELASYAPLVPDLHPGFGPIGGIEAALDHSGFEWNLLVPVDLPFLPATLLREWIRRVTADDAFRVAYFEAGGKPQPAVLLIHHEAKPSITAAIERGEYKLLPALSAAASGSSLHVEDVNAAQEYWFTNVNTPEELKMARRRFEQSASSAAAGREVPGAS
jgi:molybdopterin-guanine dinucleotide biosynthesis protein A